MLSKFFINRPIFSTVISIVIVVVGLISLFNLPVAQYPSMTPPTISVTANYPGANAQVVNDTVAQVIEQNVNGVEDMLYMSSTCGNDGTYKLTVTFKVGVDVDMATVLVQNRVAMGIASLPVEVQRLGVTTKKNTTDMVVMIAFTSDTPDYDEKYLSNFVSLRMKDELTRVKGVGSMDIYGAGDYSMRIWFDPIKLKTRHMTVTDVVNAIKEQNVQVAAGSLGAEPEAHGAKFQYTLSTAGRLKTVDEFRELVIKTGDNNDVVKIKDIATVELGSVNYGILGSVNGQPAALVPIYQLPGSNALEVKEGIAAKMKELKPSFPKGVNYDFIIDRTDFVRDSIKEVVITLFVAIILVILTILFFLQDWRATFIPAITIPVSLIGTFAVLLALGLSINLLTLFGLVLAIGIVVDDAIVVVENTKRHISEGLAPRDAAITAMNEITGAVIATTLVLLAAFVPSTMMSGITGEIFRQFAITISVATCFSTINALTLTPALCGLLLKADIKGAKVNLIYRMFEWVYGGSFKVYEKLVKLIIRWAFVSIILFIAVTGTAFWGMSKLPTGFLPTEDVGYAMGLVQLPDASSFKRSQEVSKKVTELVRKIDGIKFVITVPGFSPLEFVQASNSVAMWITFDDLVERNARGRDLQTIMAEVRQVLGSIQEGISFAFTPPAISGLGSTGGFEMKILDKGALGLAGLQAATEHVATVANKNPKIIGARTMFRATVPQLEVELDRQKIKFMNLQLSDIFTTMQVALGGSYINDFNLFGKTYQVKLQSKGENRDSIDDIDLLDVRNKNGDMVPFSAFAHVKPAFGPLAISRFNMYPTATITGGARPGYSSGEAMAVMESVANTSLPDGMGFSWSGMSFQEKAASGGAVMVFIMSGLFAYLFLSAQYESWLLSFCVMMAVPLSLIGTVVGVAARGMDMNIYSQVGIILLIGLTAKTSILIVEFARDLRNEGKSIVEAATTAALLRYRAVLMTGVSFILGTYPLLVASGTSAESRKALGTTVFFGMLAGMVLSVLLVPAFYKLLQTLDEKIFKGKRHDN